MRSLTGCALLGTLLLGTAHARPIQIIHTNDLHSHLEHATDPRRGGYAAVKSVIDRIRDDASAQGIESLILDAGDFTEGSVFYLADRGKAVWRMMNLMGYDAAVIGNHDWLMGPDELNEILGAIPPTFRLLGANFKAAAHWSEIRRHLRTHATFERSGVRIAVIGLTTPQIVFNWRNEDGYIGSHTEAAFKALGAVKDQADAVIALTHLGDATDRKLVERVSGIDLVVGGHSHTQLNAPVYARDKKRDRLVPIVQTGRHGEFVGNLLVDIEPGQPLQVLRYQLVPVEAEFSGQDPRIARAVSDVRGQLSHDLGGEWLNEVVAVSRVPLEAQAPKGPPTAWSKLVTDGLLEATGADISLDIPEFTGPSQPPGPLTRERLITLYPRVFEFKQLQGWTAWTVEVRGWLLKIALEQAVALNAGFSVSGADWDVNRASDGTPSAKNIRIGGKKIKLLKKYRMAVPEGIGRGAYQIAAALQLVLPGAKDTGIPMWKLIEDRARRIGEIRGGFIPGP